MHLEQADCGVGVLAHVVVVERNLDVADDVLDGYPTELSFSDSIRQARRNDRPYRSSNLF